MYSCVRTFVKVGLPCWCGRQHRTWRTMALCRWPKALWIAGNPPLSGPCFALAAWCHPGGTVTLWASQVEAEQSKRLIDRLACGGCCHRNHEIINLGEDGF